jgi:hypothetical protein
MERLIQRDVAPDAKDGVRIGMVAEPEETDGEIEKHEVDVGNAEPRSQPWELGQPVHRRAERLGHAVKRKEHRVGALAMNL